MGCASSNPSASGDANEKARNRRVELEQRNAAKKDSRTAKLLIIGAGGSGKTTLRKQLKTAYDQGFSEDERQNMRTIIFSNLIEGAKSVIEASRRSDIGTPISDSEECKAAIEKIESVNEDEPELSEDLAQALLTLWKDEGFQSTYKNRPKYQLQECFTSYIHELEDYPNWGGPNWIPSSDDCVKARIRSIGVVEDDLTIDGALIKLLDAGGQRAERRKWLHFFDGVTAVVFVASLSGFDEVLFEDDEQNKLAEALDLFDEMVNSKHFVDIPFMLFLNKRDLLEEKMNNGSSLNASGLYPDAPEGNDPNAAIDWMRDKFLSRKNDANTNPVYVHVTTATDTSSTRAVFDNCRDIVLKKTLSEAGLSP